MEQEIIDYVLRNSESSNPAILRTMISQMSNSNSNGGSDLFVITLDYGNNGYESDKTNAEIIEAVAANKMIVAYEPEYDEDLSYSYYLVSAHILDNEGGQLTFGGPLYCQLYSNGVQNWYTSVVN